MEKKWVKVATAPDQLVAEMWQELLKAEGIPSMIKPDEVISFLGVSPMPVSLLVPEDLLADAKAVLSEYLEES